MKIKIFLMIIIIFILSPFFYIKDIKIKNNNLVDESVIAKNYGKRKLFRFNIFDVGKIEENPYIKKVRVKYKFFNTVEVNIEEHLPYMYLLYPNNTVSHELMIKDKNKEYLLLSKDFTVLEIGKRKYQNLPICQGFEYEDIKVGKKIDINNSIKIKIKSIIDEFAKYKNNDIIRHGIVVDFDRINDVKLYFNNPEVTVLYGEIIKNSAKVNIIFEAIEKINTKGIFDIRTLDSKDSQRKGSFKPLT